jgi:hypothetical protein
MLTLQNLANFCARNTFRWLSLISGHVVIAKERREYYHTVCPPFLFVFSRLVCGDIHIREPSWKHQSGLSKRSRVLSHQQLDCSCVGSRGACWDYCSTLWFLRASAGQARIFVTGFCVLWKQQYEGTATRGITFWTYLTWEKLWKKGRLSVPRLRHARWISPART